MYSSSGPGAYEVAGLNYGMSRGYSELDLVPRGHNRFAPMGAGYTTPHNIHPSPQGGWGSAPYSGGGGMQSDLPPELEELIDGGDPSITQEEYSLGGGGDGYTEELDDLNPPESAQKSSSTGMTKLVTALVLGSGAAFLWAFAGKYFIEQNIHSLSGLETSAINWRTWIGYAGYITVMYMFFKYLFD